ncbi:portal protein [Paenibacillus tundrae]
MSTLNKIKKGFQGLFTENGAEKDSVNPNTPEEQRIYDTVYQDYQVFKQERQQMDDIWRKEQRFYMGDHWKGLRSDAVSKLRPDAVENITFSQIESIVGKLTGWMPYPNFTAQEEGDEEKARDLNDFMPFELRQIKFKQKHTRAVRRMVIHGPLIYKTVFDPTVEGGRGMNRYEGRNDIIPVDFGTFFPDPRVKDFIYLQKMGGIIINVPKPLEYFKERWPKQGTKVQPDIGTLETDVFNIDSDDGNLSTDATRQQMSGLIEYWYRGLPKQVSAEDKKLFREMAEEKLMEGVDPSEYLAKADGKMEGVHCIYITTSGVFLEHKAYVFDHGQYPFVARTLYPSEGNPWGKGFMRDMIKPQIMKNKYAEIAVETMAKQGNAAIMYEEGSISKPRTWAEQRSMPGAMLPVATGRMGGVKELDGVNVPSTVFNMLNYYDEMLQKIPGQFDSANGQANSNVTSGAQAKALMAAAGTRLNTVSDLIQDALEEVFSQYVELIAQFYTTERIARVTGRTVTMSRDSMVSRVPSDYTPPDPMVEEMGAGDMQPPDPMQGMDMMGQMDPMSMMTEPMQVEEEFVPEFDILVQIGVDKPQDREYWLQLAFNLLQTMDPITQQPMIDAEAVRYVITTGRMEPMDVIKRRIEEESGKQQQFMQAQQQAQEAQAQVQQLSQENQTMQQTLQQFSGEQMQREQQDREFEQGLKQQKMNLEGAKVAQQLMQPVRPGQG